MCRKTSKHNGILREQGLLALKFKTVKFANICVAGNCMLIIMYLRESLQYTYVHTYIHMYICMCTHIDIYVHTYIHM